MKLRTSFFEKTVLRKDITRFAPLWAIYFIGGLLVMLNVADSTGANGYYAANNVGATIVKAAGLKDYSAYGPALDDIREDSDIVRYYYKSVADKETWHEVKVCKYEVTGDAKNFNNWKLVETLDPVEEENRFY